MHTSRTHSVISQCLHYASDILFPRPPHVRELENLTPDKLVHQLPHAPLHTLEYIDSVFSYRDPRVRQFVWEIKYHNNRALAEHASVCMHDMLFDYVTEQTTVSNLPAPILIPIPISPERKKKRGFNQARVLATNIYAQDPDTYHSVCDTLTYARAHTPQTHLSKRSERLTNMKHCLTVKNPENVRGHHVIVIDDVTTTGATIKEARRALRGAGARHVHAITLAH